MKIIRRCFGFGLILLAVVILLFAAALTSAQPSFPTMGKMILSASPESIPADGISQSNITAFVTLPDIEEYGEMAGEPACGVEVKFYTTLGNITAVNNGTTINGTAHAILTAGTKAGVANVTGSASIVPASNTTSVTFVASGEVDGDGGNGGNGNGGSGNGGATTTATPASTPGETPLPSPTAGATATPTGTPMPTSVGTPTATPSPSPTKKPLIPGFGAVFAIAGLLAVVYLVLGRKRK